VVENATKRAVETNIQDGQLELMSKCLFISGSWESIASQPVAEELKFDLILMSETLYNTSYYESLVSVIDRTLKLDGQIIIGTKTFYFGLGGGFFEF
jgi:predicted nicotinamide N-methyase